MLCAALNFQAVKSVFSEMWGRFLQFSSVWRKLFDKSLIRSNLQRSIWNIVSRHSDYKCEEEWINSTSRHGERANKRVKWVFPWNVLYRCPYFWNCNLNYDLIIQKAVFHGFDLQTNKVSLKAIKQSAKFSWLVWEEVLIS